MVESMRGWKGALMGISFESADTFRRSQPGAHRSVPFLERESPGELGVRDALGRDESRAPGSDHDLRGHLVRGFLAE